jgi:hypothetical protein
MVSVSAVAHSRVGGRRTLSPLQRGITSRTSACCMKWIKEHLTHFLIYLGYLSSCCQAKTFCDEDYGHSA